MDYLPVSIENGEADLSKPEGQVSLANLKTVAVTAGARLHFPRQTVDSVLVLASAYDKRQKCSFILRSPDRSWEYLLNADFCSHGQRFHIVVPAGYDCIEVEALEEDRCLWVLDDPERLPASVPALWPKHDGIDVVSRFFQRLETDCLAQFGWMGGCVLQAFESLAQAGDAPRWENAITNWLNPFLDEQHLVYQDPHGKPLTDQFNTIETTLPIATIAKRLPAHPIVDTTIRYLSDEASLGATCEGCYTVAFPLMQIGQARNDSALMHLAFEQLQHRRTRLCVDGQIYLRFRGTHHTYRNWSRGIAWYLLGFAECIHLSDRTGPWVDAGEHLAERSRWILKYQRKDGLWSNFLYEPELPPDTAGSAGIASALLKAHRLGLIGPEAIEAAERCWAGLQAHIFTDGWLGGTSSSNKRGESVQHSPNRSSETFGMGLMGILAGLLAKSK